MSKVKKIDVYYILSILSVLLLLAVWWAASAVNESLASPGQKMIIYFDVSPITPNHRITMGIHARGGTGLKMEKTGQNIRRNVGKIPKHTPSPTNDSGYSSGFCGNCAGGALQLACFFCFECDRKEALPMAGTGCKIKLESVSKSFDDKIGRTAVLDEISLNVYENEFLVILLLLYYLLQIRWFFSLCSGSSITRPASGSASARPTPRT